MILSITVILFIFYAYIMVFILRGLNKLAPIKTNYQKHFFSIIVPARNEENSIGKLIESVFKQSYDSSLIELIIIDDRSSDKTAEIVQSYQKDYPKLFLLRETTVDHLISPKKKALISGIEKASGEIILTTDADCTFRSDWLIELNNYYCNDVDVVCAPVTFSEGKNKFFTRIQELDFLSLIATSAGAIGMKSPVICNGANFSFRQSAFYSVGGYDGVENVKSGEDDQLLYKFKDNNFNISYCWKSETLAKTTPIENFKDFLNQRKRWGSLEVKSGNDLWKFKLYGIYFFNLSLLIIMIVMPFSLSYFLFFCSIILGKFIIEMPIISKVIQLVEKPILWCYVPFVLILQIPYVAIVGALANITTYTWKE